MDLKGLPGELTLVLSFAIGGPKAQGGGRAPPKPQGLQCGGWPRTRDMLPLPVGISMPGNSGALTARMPGSTLSSP